VLAVSPPPGWTPRHDVALVVGVLRHGFGSWDAMRADPALAPLGAAAAAVAAGGGAATPDGWLDTRARLLASVAALDAAAEARPSPFAEALRRGVLAGAHVGGIVAWAEQQPPLDGLARAAGIE
jgi:hypothetical protein